MSSPLEAAFCRSRTNLTCSSSLSPNSRLAALNLSSLIRALLSFLIRAVFSSSIVFIRPRSSCFTRSYVLRLLLRNPSANFSSSLGLPSFTGLAVWSSLARGLFANSSSCAFFSAAISELLFLRTVILATLVLLMTRWRDLSKLSFFLRYSALKAVLY